MAQIVDNSIFLHSYCLIEIAILTQIESNQDSGSHVVMIYKN